MDDAKRNIAFMAKLHEQHFGKAEDQALAKRLTEEKVRAAVQMAEAYANLQIPEDILSRAKAWRMESFMTVLWNNAFQAGYRQALRDSAAKNDAAMDGRK